MDSKNISDADSHSTLSASSGFISLDGGFNDPLFMLRLYSMRDKKESLNKMSQMLMNSLYGGRGPWLISELTVDEKDSDEMKTMILDMKKEYEERKLLKREEIRQQSKLDDEIGDGDSIYQEIKDALTDEANAKKAILAHKKYCEPDNEMKPLYADTDDAEIPISNNYLWSFNGHQFDVGYPNIGSACYAVGLDDETEKKPETNNSVHPTIPLGM